jgi:cyclophilin family peptidyl-prolyl cis-trans isomerase
MKDMSDSLTSTLEAETFNLGKLLNEVYRYERKQQDLVLKVIDALSQAKRDLEEDLMSGGSFFAELPQVHDLLTSARKSLQNGNSESLSHLSALISSLTCRKQQLEGVLFRAMVSPLHACGSTPNTDALKLIHNYTSAKLGYNTNLPYNTNGGLKSNSLISPPKYSPNSLTLNNAAGPRFFFDMDIQGVLMGRIIIETRPDVAPRMCENFKALATKERGFGFLGCVVFQCWKGESVITGDFEHNNGRGGHSIYEEGLFMPEDTRLPATRGAIGMRRTQKRHDSKGLVGSQFRIILQDMPGFTGIFGHILDGIEIIDKISECGDPSGNPTKRISIRKCGALK